MEPHRLEIRSPDDARADLPRLAQSHQAEPDGGEIAEFAERLYARAQIVQLRYREIHILSADSRRALANVYKPVLVAVNQRTQEHPADQREDRRVRADAQRQRNDDRNSEP